MKEDQISPKSYQQRSLWMPLSAPIVVKVRYQVSQYQLMNISSSAYAFSANNWSNFKGFFLNSFNPQLSIFYFLNNTLPKKKDVTAIDASFCFALARRQAIEFEMIFNVPCVQSRGAIFFMKWQDFEK